MCWRKRIVWIDIRPFPRHRDKLFEECRQAANRGLPICHATRLNINVAFSTRRKPNSRSSFSLGCALLRVLRKVVMKLICFPEDTRTLA